MLATGAVFMFLLGIIGAGIYYFSASTGATSAKTDVSTASTVAAVPLPTRTAPPMQPPPTSAPAAKGPQTPVSDKPAREGSSPAPDTVTRPRAASAVAEKGKGTSSANTQEPAVPSPPPASIDALVPASTAATSSQLEAIARQNPVRNVEAPLQEIAVPPAVIAAPMPPPESILGRPVPASTPNVLAMAALSREGSRASAAPKVDAAVLISKVSPVYPEVARRMRISGTVPVEIEIDENGRVTKATPAGGPPILRSAAVSAVLKWRFRPAAVNNTNIRSQGRVSIVFDKP
jgi:TonB family protein